MRYYSDPVTGEPHSYGHGVSETYAPSRDADDLFVITAYELHGKSLRAFTRRMKGRRR